MDKKVKHQNPKSDGLTDKKRSDINRGKQDTFLQICKEHISRDGVDKLWHGLKNATFSRLPHLQDFMAVMKEGF